MSNETSWIERMTAPGDPARRAEFRRIGEATRQIIDSVVDSRAPTDVLAVIAQQIEAVAESIGSFPSGRAYEGFAEAANAGANGGFLDFSPVSGSSNPLAPPVELTLEHDDSGEPIVVGMVNFASAYEGPPGNVHGGYLAAAFDEVLGLAQSLSGSPGMTARLVVNYRNPTPWGTPLRFEARIDKRDGRKVYTTGTCYAGDVLTAEAEALFISVDFNRLADLAAKRQGTSGVR